MLRVYFLQLWFNLSDPAVEEALYESTSMRNFAGIDLGVEAAPDETTVCKFRHLLEKNKLGKKLLVSVNEHLRRSGIKITTGTIVDATIIGAPSSTKNKDGKRDPEMHQTAKGKQWYFGMKAHIGVDSRTKLIHTVLASAANVADCHALQYLLHGKERRVWGDQAYRGQRAAIRAGAPRAKDFTNQRYRWGKHIDESVKATNRRKSQRARQSRARVWGHQAGIRLSESVLPRLGEEPAPARGHRGARESVLGAAEIAQCVGNVSAKAAENAISRRERKLPRKRAIAPTENEIPLPSLSSSPP